MFRNSKLITLALVTSTLLVLQACSLDSKALSTKTSDAATTSVTTKQDNAKQSASYQQPSKNEYVYVGEDKAMYLHWVEVDKKIQGQLQMVNLISDKDGKSSLNRDSGSFTGLHSDGTVSLQFPNGTIFTGTLKGEELSLNVSSGEKLDTHNLKPGTVAQFNKGVDDLQTRIEQGKLRDNLVYLDDQIQTYKTVNKFFPTFPANNERKIKNQPTVGHSAQVDFNAPNFRSSWGLDRSLNQITPASYYGVTAAGIVFATSSKPDMVSSDSMNGNNGNSTGNGYWTNGDINVIISEFRLKKLKLRDLEKMTYDEYIKGQHG
ncbi:hypothetical protein SAMN04487897_10954 [Paenibacillus sp. yr247]|uniref:hypothetical protein n=1 Tax=Paenibacillus sp. yr247 TaxID=1761880 RepID=UPI000886BB27|nr:hypothetical protein [Paenibacillus sp. yr247]SDO16117.1 hypothetical protein SAMN04487897_10954 [Paenibacillus sp. yr247]